MTVPIIKPLRPSGSHWRRMPDLPPQYSMGYDYEVWQHFSGHSRRVVCDHCGGDWGMNDDCRAFVPWSDQFADMYRVMGHKIRERRESLLGRDL